jgi:hypothetical protein
MTTRIIYSIRREDYDAIKQLVADKPWPDTFEEWREADSKIVGKIEARGDIVEQVIVDPKQFAAYCHTSRIDHNETTLMAFAVARYQAKRRA